MATATYGEVSWERMSKAIEKVRQRLFRAARALDQAGVPYAVAGGNAVAAWVSRVDEAAVRNTQGVDILLRRGEGADRKWFCFPPRCRHGYVSRWAGGKGA
jgi:hypothetical protein